MIFDIRIANRFTDSNLKYRNFMSVTIASEDRYQKTHHIPHFGSDQRKCCNWWTIIPSIVCWRAWRATNLSGNFSCVNFVSYESSAWEETWLKPLRVWLIYQFPNVSLWLMVNAQTFTFQICCYWFQRRLFGVKITQISLFLMWQQLI